MSGLLALTAPLLLPAFTWGGSAFTWLELVATVLAVWMVVCNLRGTGLAGMRAWARKPADPPAALPHG